MSEAPAALRSQCLVPGCRRTTKESYNEWICATHWALLPLMRRKVYSRAKRDCRKAVGLERGRLGLRCADLWESLKQMAIERAAGI